LLAIQNPVRLDERVLPLWRTLLNTDLIVKDRFLDRVLLSVLWRLILSAEK
jgi:hypothetical protein